MIPADAVQQQDEGELPVGEVHREQFEEPEGRGGHHHAAGGEGPRAEPVGQPAGSRPGHQEADGQRQHRDPGPQRGLLEAVAVHGQVDALQPDDQDEHQPAAAQAGQQAGQVPGRERPDPEQREPEHRLGHPRLDHAEEREHGQAAEDQRQHQRAGPAHRVPAVGLNAVGDPGQHRDQTHGEGHVAPPVQRGRTPDPELT